MAAEAELDPASPEYVQLMSAFLAMEPPEFVLSLARACGRGLNSESVQRFFWEHCMKTVGNSNAAYVKSFLKKLINKVESENGQVLDELYEQYAIYMCSNEDKGADKESMRICKVISFLFPKSSRELLSCPISRKLMVTLQCSLNMLEGDTGCSVWPSSLFLSEFILSFPDIFTGKSCFEVGSGVGLVGICLAHVKASNVILSDGDLLTLTNMKLNLEMNGLDSVTNLSEQSTEAQCTVSCVHLPWESATEEGLHYFNPDIILGADVIYDPSYLPHLVRLLASLLCKTKSSSEKQRLHCSKSTTETDVLNLRAQHGPVACIATVIRNIETFNCFLTLAEEADLVIRDLTGKLKPFDFVPYMRSYDRSSIRLLALSSR